jgi:hypothetical protein
MTAHLVLESERGPRGASILLPSDSRRAERRFGFHDAGIGQVVPVRLAASTLEYTWGGSQLKPHGDMLAAAAVLALFPVVSRVPTKVTFGWPTSFRLQKAIRLLPADIVVDGGDRCQPLSGSGAVISFGGGIDSLATATLYPNLCLVHEIPISVGDADIESATLNTQFFRRRQTLTVATNQRTLYQRWGVGSWGSVLAPALLANPATIITGLNALDNAYLQRGLGYRHPRQSVDQRFFDFFAALGIRVVQSTWKSELVSSSILSEAGLIDEAAYCGRLPLRDCGRCPKCLRRRTLRALVEDDSSILHDFEPSEESLHALTARPLHWGHIFGLAKDRRLLPAWMATRVSDAYPRLRCGALDFHARYYRPGFITSGLRPDEVADLVDRLEGIGVKPMGSSDQRNMHAFR